MALQLEREEITTETLLVASQVERERILRSMEFSYGKIMSLNKTIERRRVVSLAMVEPDSDAANSASLEIVIPADWQPGARVCGKVHSAWCHTYNANHTYKSLYFATIYRLGPSVQKRGKLASPLPLSPARPPQHTNPRSWHARVCAGTKLETMLADGQCLILSPPEGAKPGMSLEFKVPEAHSRVEAMPARPKPEQEPDQPSVEAHVRSVEDEWEQVWQNEVILREFPANDKLIDRLEMSLSSELHALIIPPKDSEGCRDWNSKSQKRWVSLVLWFTFFQVLLTWLLFHMSMYHYREMRMTKAQCADGGVLANQTSESIAATCPTAALDKMASRITLKDPLYEAALNYTGSYRNSPIFGEGNSDSHLERNALLVIQELFLFLFLSQKLAHAIQMLTLALAAGGLDRLYGGWNFYRGLLSFNRRADVFSKMDWDLIRCGAMLELFCLSQVFANLGITLTAWSSGESLFTTVLTTFVLTKVAEMDSALYKLLHAMGKKRDSTQESEARNRAHKREKLRKLRSNPATRKDLRNKLKEAKERWNETHPDLPFTRTSLVGLVKNILFLCNVVLISAMVYGFMLAVTGIFIAVHDLHYSEFTVSALSFGTDYRDWG